MAGDFSQNPRIQQLVEWVQDQVWYQQLKAKWDELDHESQFNLKVVSIGLGMVLMLGSSLWLSLSVRSEKKNLVAKNDLIHLLQGANEEVRRLKEINSRFLTTEANNTGGKEAPWKPYFDGLTNNAGLTPQNLTLGDEKEGASSETTKETLFSLTIKKANIKQLIKFAVALENGARPVKIRNLTWDTKLDPDGYIDGTFAISAFSLKTP